MGDDLIPFLTERPIWVTALHLQRFYFSPDWDALEIQCIFLLNLLAPSSAPRTVLVMNNMQAHFQGMSSGEKTVAQLIAEACAGTLDLDENLLGITSDLALSSIPTMTGIAHVHFYDAEQCRHSSPNSLPTPTEGEPK